ncbi:unnamed protein product [Euphydryas editha]|uniref:Uncharacterized protein n=1 Tax=Euphydryas editha TaxID=104508 RepID=A0AAU9TCQ5_EUPED|nr:unnamed protein product [Euphydryas editha]
MEYAFKELLTTYMTQKYVATTPLSQVNTENKTEFIPLENIYQGVQVLEELKKAEVSIRPDLVEDFRAGCRNSLIKLYKGIQERFDSDDHLLNMLPLLHPSKVVSRNVRTKLKTKPENFLMTSAILYDSPNKQTADAEEDHRTINDLDVIFEEI